MMLTHIVIESLKERLTRQTKGMTLLGKGRRVGRHEDDDIQGSEGLKKPGSRIGTRGRTQDNGITNRDCFLWTTDRE